MVTIDPIKKDDKDAKAPEGDTKEAPAAKDESAKKPVEKKEKTDSDKALEAAERAAHVEELIKSQKYRLPIK